MNIWIISAYETTLVDDTRPMRFMGIADGIVNRGHSVTYFNNTFRHATKKERFIERTSKTINENYEMIFVYSKPYNSNVSLGRLLSHNMFSRNLIKEFNGRSKPDVIFISLPPLSSVEKVTLWAKNNKIPVVVDIIDPWPDVIIRLVPHSLQQIFKTLTIPMRLKLKNIFSRVSGVTAISDEYIAWSKILTSDQVFHRAFYPAVDFKGIRSFMNELAANEGSRKLRIIYAGSLGMSYDIPTILQAAKLLEERRPGEVEFIICGVGPQEKVIDAYTEDYQNVKYLGRIGHKQLLEQYHSSDLGLIQHISSATQSVTYKLFDYLSAGLPILNSLQSEVVNLIEQNKVGLNNAPGDGAKLAGNIDYFITNPVALKEYKNNAVKFTSEYGDSAVVYDRLVQFLEEIVNSKENVSTFEIA